MGHNLQSEKEEGEKLDKLGGVSYYHNSHSEVYSLKKTTLAP